MVVATNAIMPSLPASADRVPQFAWKAVHDIRSGLLKKLDLIRLPLKERTSTAYQGCSPTVGHRVPAITLEGDGNGAPHGKARGDAKKFLGKYVFILVIL